jgi:hypothetical protein
VSFPLSIASGLNAVGQIYEFEWGAFGWSSAILIVCYVLFQKMKFFFSPEEQENLDRIKANIYKKGSLKKRTYLFAAIILCLIALDQFVGVPRFLNFYEVIPLILILVILMSLMMYAVTCIVPMSKARAITLNVIVPYVFSFLYFPAIAITSNCVGSDVVLTTEYQIVASFPKTSLGNTKRRRKRTRTWCYELVKTHKDSAPHEAYICGEDRGRFEVSQRFVVNASKGLFGQYMLEDFVPK